MKRVALACLAATLGAQTPPSSADEADLLALLNTPVTVASRKAMTIRESPGVVTLVTRDEIQASGARDLVDVLALVPGFDFGVDNEGVVGPSFRGIWGYEGKILLLWDGIEMNETLYGNIALGSHYPVDQIQRIEIIRGPGSAMYGGFAEVAVIKVTTLQAGDLHGVAGGLAYGRGSGGSLNTQGNALFGWSGDGVAVTLGAFGGSGERSRQTYTDALGQSFPMAGNSTIQPLLVNLGVNVGGLAIRAVTDQYKFVEGDGFGVNLGEFPTQRFTNNCLDLRYEWKAGETLTLTPYASYRDQKPWWISGARFPGDDFMIMAVREKAGLMAAWAPKPAVDVQFGYEFTRDQGTLAPGNPPVYATFVDGSTRVAYTDSALFAQAQYQGAANVTVGARYERHSEAGSAFVPRFALTKAVARWHFKLLAAQSFRMPDLYNINEPLVPGSPILPEKTSSFEVEVGYQIGTGVLSVNLFDMKVSQPLVYTAVSVTDQGYINQGSVASRGIEAQYQVRMSWGFLNASVESHTMDNQVSYWSVPGSTTQALGFPNGHASVQAGIKLGGGWSLNPSVRYLASRQGYTYVAAAQGLALVNRKADVVVDGNVAYTDGPVTVSLGLFDATNQQVPFMQPYNGGHSFLPGQGQEVLAKLKYGF